MSLFYMEGILIQNFFITLSTYDKTWILPPTSQVDWLWLGASVENPNNNLENTKSCQVV